MTDADQQHKFCDKCGIQVSRNSTTCPSCGTYMGGNKAATIVIVCAVVGTLFLGSIFFIGILAAIALPNFIGAQKKAKVASVRANMRTVQIAAESYACDFEGLYPLELNNEFKSYFPGGSNGKPFTPGVGLMNPITAETEWPVIGHLTSVQDARQEQGEPLGKGQVEYSVIYDASHRPVSYAIRGGDAEGMPVKVKDGVNQLVLSNQ